MIRRILASGALTLLAAGAFGLATPVAQAETGAAPVVAGWGCETYLEQAKNYRELADQARRLGEITKARHFEKLAKEAMDRYYRCIKG
ncbi:hypothetical protein [Amycolatopsis anabasis]|uniref:hypothetical protein n=1 Tax=Amycolatopsis anabasis TaxID=1840409 RepID=UPI00131B2B86|nr:hypothetical protein [Amycolatopsis anabasis]